MAEMKDIQWFPGHMTKTKRQIRASLKLVDAVAEIIDARIPVSSRNPDLNQLIQNKPRVILMNKCDMANRTATKLWIDHYAAQGVTALAVDCKSGRNLNQFPAAVNTVMQEKIARMKAKGMKNPTIRVMIVGIPNVGKKTAKDLATRFGSVSALSAASEEELLAVEEIGVFCVVFNFCLLATCVVVREVKLFALQVVYSVQDVCLSRAVGECVGVAVSGSHYHILLCLRIVNYLCGVEAIHYAIALAKEHSAL